MTANGSAAALRNLFVFFLVLSSYGNALSSEPESGGDGPVPMTGQYVRIHDITMYYQSVGTGEPILMVHGIFGDHSRWQQQAVPLSSEFMVLTPDSRGRGRSSDGDGPLSYGRMAADIVGLMDDLGVREAHMIGHSEGAGIVLHALVDYPDRVASAVLIGAFYNVNNKPAAFQRANGAIMDKLGQGLPLTAEEERATIEGPFASFKATLLSQTPDPSRFPVIMSKMHASFMTQPTFTLDVLSTIERPVLIIRAHNDPIVPVQVFDDMGASIPNAELADFPEGGHMVMVDQSEEINVIIREFIRRHPIENHRH